MSRLGSPSKKEVEKNAHDLPFTYRKNNDAKRKPAVVVGATQALRLRTPGREASPGPCGMSRRGSSSKKEVGEKCT